MAQTVDHRYVDARPNPGNEVEDHRQDRLGKQVGDNNFAHLKTIVFARSRNIRQKSLPDDVTYCDAPSRTTHLSQAKTSRTRGTNFKLL